MLSLTHTILHLHTQIVTECLSHSPISLDRIVTTIHVKNGWVGVYVFCQENTSYMNMSPRDVFESSISFLASNNSAFT